MTVGGGLAAYQFLYPRQKKNEFGGKFYLGVAADLPAIDSEPQANVYGRFWLANTEEGLYAFYEICTQPWNGNPHKYRWDSLRGRFECGVCGARFSRDGLYTYGPAPRDLDQFVVEIRSGRKVIAKTNRTHEIIHPPTVPFPGAEIIVDTGAIIEGMPSGVGLTWEPK